MSPRAAVRAVPHVIPYQGSKRVLAARILATVEGRSFERMFEPFAGSAAITLAAASRKIASSHVLADTLQPLIEIWQAVITAPDALADAYAALWNEQHAEPDHFTRVRGEFNAAPDPARLLYLLARCVKNAPRFNAAGEFNQSADKRRTGTRPETMRQSILDAAALLEGRATAHHGDATDTLATATPTDLVYLDPPWEGTTVGTDKRYHQGLQRERLIILLEELNRRGVPYLLSYDGSLGTKTYGDPLPDHLELARVDLDAGRSSQATLAGRADRTIEALYLSPALRSDH